MGEDKFKLVPLYDLQAVLNTWKYYVPGVEAILNNSGNDTNLEKIYNDVMSGKLLLWVGFVNGAYAGFVTTSFHIVPMKGKFLWIVHTYKKIKVSSTFLLRGLLYLEGFAKDAGCRGIKFYAKEKPWQEKLVRIGYEPGYVEYIKNIGEDRDEDLPEARSGDENGSSPV